MTLWHGTTESAAKRIADGGFERMDTVRIVSEVAVEHGLDPADVLSVLRTAGRFVVIQQGRDDAVWFATSKDKADRWAQRAPEARWEALWAAWWLQNGGYEQAPSPWMRSDAAAWHARQFFDDPPAVVEVRVPVDRVQGQGPLSPVDVITRVQIGTPQLSVTHPIPAAWILGYEVLPRHVDFTPAAGLLQLDFDELTHLVDSGAAPPLRPPKQVWGEDWYWHLDEFLPLWRGSVEEIGNGSVA